MTKTWKTPEGDYLLQGALETLPLNTRVELPSGEQIDRAAAYYHVSAAGRVQRVYSAPIDYSLDDTLGIANIHVVIENSLYELHWISHDENAPVVKTRLVLAGLTDYDMEALPLDPPSVIRRYDEWAKEDRQWRFRSRGGEF